MVENKNASTEIILTFCVLAQCRLNLATYLPSQLLVKILCHQILKVHTFTWKKQKPLLPTLVIWYMVEWPLNILISQLMAAQNV